MAAVRTMLSAAREEAAVLTAELASSARVAAVESVASSSRIAGEVVNPLAVRQAVEAGVKEAAGGSAALSEHLALSARPTTLPGGGVPASAITQTLEHTALKPSSALASTSRSLVGQSLEQELGVSVREAISNAGQTGLEEQMSEAIEVAKVLGEGHASTVQEAVMQAEKAL